MPPAGHTKQSSRLSKKLKSMRQPRKRGVREKKKLKRQRRRSELEKLLNVLKQRPRPTRNDGTRRGLRGRRSERSKNRRGSWLPKGKKIVNYNRACESSLVGLEAKDTLLDLLGQSSMGMSTRPGRPPNDVSILNLSLRFILIEGPGRTSPERQDPDLARPYRSIPCRGGLPGIS